MKNRLILSISLLTLSLILSFYFKPDELTTQAWNLFIIFFTAILFIILNILPIFISSITAISVALLTNTLTPKQAFGGFSEDFILLIVVAFLIAKGVVNSGLGKRIAYLMIERFGKTTLGLSYSVNFIDLLIAPAFPSNTARSATLFPIVNSLSIDNNSHADDSSRKKMGAYLMMSTMASLTLSSALWITAMAANAIGVAIAKKAGVDISYLSWTIAALPAVIILFFLVPYVIYRVFEPTIKTTPQAKDIAKEKLRVMGSFSKKEYIMAGVFILLVTLWSLSSLLGINKTAVALLGLSILMISKIFTLNDLKSQGSALETLIWFAILYSMSVSLDELGFMSFVASHMANYTDGLSWFSVYTILVVGYVFIHYFFVSQSAHMLALYGLFLSVGISSGVDPTLLALMLLFATNFNAMITPQGSSANIIFLASGYINAKEVYRVGLIVTIINTLVFMLITTPWILLIF